MAKKGAGLRLNQVLLQVKSVERSKDFYTKKLGFKLQYDFSPEYVALKTTNNLQIGLHPARNKTTARRSKEQPVAIEFDVDNVDSWYDRLRKKGVVFSKKPENAPWGEREARFKDPDGYLLAISAPVKSK